MRDAVRYRSSPKNPCSIGYAGRGAVTNNAPNTVAALVNGVQSSPAEIQALVSGGTTYPLARKLYLNTVRGFESLLTSNDPSAPTGKDAELDLTACYANLPFSTFASVGGTSQIFVDNPAFGFVSLPGATPKALCEDYNGKAVCADASNTDACQGNENIVLTTGGPAGLIPTSRCNNGLKDGDETGPDVCPTGRTCDSTTHHCI